MDGRIRYGCGRASEKPSPMGQNFCMPAFKSLDLTLQFRLLPAFHTRPVCALGTLSPGEGLCQSPSHLLILRKCQPPLHKGAFCVFLKHKHTAAVSSGGQTVKKVVSFRASVHTGSESPGFSDFFSIKTGILLYFGDCHVRLRPPRNDMLTYMQKGRTFRCGLCIYFQRFNYSRVAKCLMVRHI